MRASDPRNLPRYSYQEADRLAGLGRGTARRWLKGYAYSDTAGKRVARPPVTPRDEVQPAASFLDLVELVAIGGFKDLGYGIPQIRLIVSACREIFRVERPLTSLQFKAGARQVFVDHPDERLVEVLRTRGQRAWNEVLEPFLQTLEYDKVAKQVLRWWPQGLSGSVVVDPDFGFGLPVIRETGIRTEIVFERFLADEEPSSIAEEFAVDLCVIDSVIRFEAKRLKEAA